MFRRRPSCLSKVDDSNVRCTNHRSRSATMYRVYSICPLFGGLTSCGKRSDIVSARLDEYSRCDFATAVSTKTEIWPWLVINPFCNTDSMVYQTCHRRMPVTQINRGYAMSDKETRILDMVLRRPPRSIKASISSSRQY